MHMLQYVLPAAISTSSAQVVIQSLEQARTGLKDIRNFEAKLQGSRDKRADTRARMIKLIDNNGEQAKIQALRSELSHLEQLDET